MPPPTLVPLARDPNQPDARRHLPIPLLGAAAIGGVLWIARQPVGALVGGGLFGAALYLLLRVFDGSRRVAFAVGDGRLAVRGDVFAETIALADLDLEKARAVDLTTDPALGLRWRILGTGLPGYSAGEFSLRNGELALVFVSDRKKVLHLPRRGAPALLLSVADPEAFRALLIRARG